MDGLEVIFQRRSIRSYTGEKISEEDLKTILKAGMAAPSAMNSQPWEFLLVRSRETLEQLSQARPYWKMLRQADAAIVVLGNIREYKSTTTDFFVQDCSAAAENMLLAATALGLGGVWLGLHPKTEVQEVLREMFHIPEGVVPFSVISLGVPNEQKEAHRDFHEQKVHRESY